MGDDSTNQKKRKSKWVTSYSSMSLEDAEDRLGLRIATLELQAISVAKMLAEAKYKQDAGDAILNNTRERVYDRILDHLVAEGYPSESDPYFKEVNISDLVYATIVPIIVDFNINRRNTIQLQRERQIIATDSATGGYEEFVVVDWISMREAKFVFVIEAKRSSLGQAMKQCLLAMKDMKDSNGGGMVYGFTTTGDLWRMVTYDGELFKMTEQFFAVFPGMRVEKERWMKDYSALVDCMYLALSNGGID